MEQGGERVRGRLPFNFKLPKTYKYKLFSMKYSKAFCICFKTRAVPPPEGAAEREGEEQRPRGTAEAHKYSPMETTGGEAITAPV